MVRKVIFNRLLLFNNYLLKRRQQQQFQIGLNFDHRYKFISIEKFISLIGLLFSSRLTRIYNVSRSSKIWIPSLMAFSFTTVKDKFIDDKEEENKLLLLLDKLDKLFEENNFDELIKVLQSIPNWQDNNEITWRLARCYYHQLKYKYEKGSSEYLEILKNSLSLVEKSLEVNDKCGPAQKWAAIILDEYSTALGIKVRITNLLRIKDHMEKAIEFSPNDPTVYYLLGEWHYGCSSVTWVERNIAKIIYGTLPEASYEKALEMFEQAEKVKPGFYSKNEIMIAKTLLALNRDKDKAIDHLKSIANNYKQSKKWADVEAYKEAILILSKFGEKVPS